MIRPDGPLFLRHGQPLRGRRWYRCYSTHGYAPLVISGFNCSPACDLTLPRLHHQPALFLADHPEINFSHLRAGVRPGKPGYPPRYKYRFEHLRRQCCPAAVRRPRRWREARCHGIGAYFAVVSLISIAVGLRTKGRHQGAAGARTNSVRFFAPGLRQAAS